MKQKGPEVQDRVIKRSATAIIPRTLPQTVSFGPLFDNYLPFPCPIGSLGRPAHPTPLSLEAVQ
jgi:hypothetical protein